MLKRIMESLRRKYGPLPLWAWAAIAGGALALWYGFRRGPALEQEAPAPAFAFGPEQDFGDTGEPAAIGGVAPVEPETGDLYPDNRLRQTADDLIDQIRGISDELALASSGPSEPGGEEAVPPDQPGEARVKRGVDWYGQTFATKAGLAAELARRGYRGARSPAEAWRVWAKLHPAAVRKLAGPKPKPAPKQVPKARRRPSPRQTGREPAKAGRGAGGARARSPLRPKPKPARPRTRALPGAPQALTRRRRRIFGRRRRAGGRGF